MTESDHTVAVFSVEEPLYRLAQCLDQFTVCSIQAKEMPFQRLLSPTCQGSQEFQDYLLL